jgi:hypothetical protein
LAGGVGELAEVVGADLGLLGELRDVGSRDAELLAQTLQFGAAFARRLVRWRTSGWGWDDALAERPGGRGSSVVC